VKPAAVLAPLAVLSGLVVPVFADNPPKPQPVPVDVQPSPKPSVRDQFASVAQTITTGASAKEVERASEGLGKPRVTFMWCNSAGCVDHESELGSNSMWVSWTKDDGDNAYVLGVMFCTPSPGSWKAASVTVNRYSKTPGAFGTSPKPEKLYEDIDTRGCMAD